MTDPATRALEAALSLIAAILCGCYESAPPAADVCQFPIACDSEAGPGVCQDIVTGGLAYYGECGCGLVTHGGEVYDTRCDTRYDDGCVMLCGGPL